MKKLVIGYIYNARSPGIEDKIFFEVAKQLKIHIVQFNLAKRLDEDEIEDKAEGCDVVYNNSGEHIATELTKTIESFGVKVIQDSKAAYYMEDKWLFFLKCKRNKIPTPQTILLSTNFNSAKEELKKFNHWPVVLKRVYGCKGEFVEKADNADEAIRIIKHFWKKGSNERLPVLAQELIDSDSYRVLTIGKDIAQTVLKKRNGSSWKATGVYGNSFSKFRIDHKLKKIVKKLIKVSKIDVCGMDFAKREDKWLVIEVNPEPAFDFFEDERRNLVKKVLLYLKRYKL